MNRKFYENLKSELDKHMTSLQVVFDSALEKNMDGDGDDITRMVTENLSGLMQTIGCLLGRAELLSEERVSIQTPDGVLVAFPDGDEDHPGITVELERSGADTVRLAMIEHTSGEGVCGYDPRHPEETERERKEVPPSFLEGEDGVKPCLICRSWPKPCENDELHYRTFYTLDGGQNGSTAI